MGRKARGGKTFTRLARKPQGGSSHDSDSDEDAFANKGAYQRYDHVDSYEFKVVCTTRIESERAREKPTSTRQGLINVLSSNQSTRCHKTLKMRRLMRMKHLPPMTTSGTAMLVKSESEVYVVLSLSLSLSVPRDCKQPRATPPQLQQTLGNQYIASANPPTESIDKLFKPFR
jgi:hypothetical protein